MADKDFRVKNKLHVNGLSNSSGVILATNHALDSHTNVPTQYGGTGTTVSPNAGQFLYSSSGTTYSPTDLSSVVPVNKYQTSMPSTGTTGQIWIDSDASALTISNYVAPTIGSTIIPSNTTVSTISGLTLSSPTLTGIPIAPTASSGNNSNQVATTSFATTVATTKVDDHKIVTTNVHGITDTSKLSTLGKSIIISMIFGG